MLDVLDGSYGRRGGPCGGDSCRNWRRSAARVAAVAPGNSPLVPSPRAAAPILQGRSCQVVSQRVIYQDASSGGEVKHVELSMDRGVPWEAALAFK